MIIIRSKRGDEKRTSTTKSIKIASHKTHFFFWLLCFVQIRSDFLFWYFGKIIYYELKRYVSPKRQHNKMGNFQLLSI